MSLVSAGSNAQGQLATGDCEDAHAFTRCRFDGYEPGRLPTGTQKVVQLAFGANHTLLLLDRAQDSSPPVRELWGSGDGSKYQLGPAVQTSTQTFVPLTLRLEELGLQGYHVRSVAACWETSYVVLEHPELGDALLSMGSDDFGDLGIGGLSKDKARSVHRVQFVQECVGEDVLSRIRILSFATGAHHVVAELSLEYAGQPTQRRLIGWGTSRHGQLGDLRNPHNGRPLPFVNSPRAISIPLEDPIVDMALGNQHSISLSSSGRVAALGSNRRGQLSSLDDLLGISAVGCTWNGSYVVAQRDKIWSIISTGSAHKGQLGRLVDLHATDGHPPGPVEFPFSSDTHDFVKMACGSEHVLCLFSHRVPVHGGSHRTRREVWAWGWNEHGTLGNGNMEDQELPIKVWPPDEHSPSAVDVAAGCGNSWIVLGSLE